MASSHANRLGCQHDAFVRHCGSHDEAAAQACKALRRRRPSTARTPAGGKLWRLAYRFDGKQKQLALGSHPEVGLADARKARDAAKATLATGTDPSEKAKADKAARKVATANTFGAIADELIAKMERERKAGRTISKVTWLLGIARQDLENRPISGITAAEVPKVLKAVDERGNHETAKRLRATVGGVFRYAIATTRAGNDPTYALKGALTSPTVVHRAAITTPKELGALLRAIQGFDGRPTTRAALQLMAILFPRPEPVGILA
ncbi:tyrosine-type recombinase/integrase [Xanthobacter pseudotagetidis]|uniref:tyrosine-type recombinase/integrase n=1 Tax=Xanthobacter pseudotagetidis TaxID=3119911 RepID=UPI00372971B7